MTPDIAQSIRKGMPALDCVQRVIGMLPDIQVVNFLKYHVRPNLEQRLSGHPAKTALQRIGQLQLHDASGRKLSEVRRGDVTAVRELVRETLDGSNAALGIVSKVRTVNGLTMHIPMMDLRIEVSEANQAEVVEILRTISPGRGVLLASGDSYHFYSIDLLSEREWVTFMGRSLLLSPWVDERYIAHRLIDGFSVLRLTTTQSKPSVPFVVDAW